MDMSLVTADDARAWVLQLLGVPPVAILTITTLYWLAAWARELLDAGRAASAVGLWLSRVSREGWSAARPAVRVSITFAGLAIGQGVAVSLLYLTSRMLYSLPLVIQPADGPVGPVWSTFVASVVAAPTEDTPWTLYVFVASLATVATFDAALVFRAKTLAFVTSFAVMVLAFALYAVMFVVGGLSLLVLIVIGLFHGAAELSGADGGAGLAWPMGLALGVATGVSAAVTIGAGAYFSGRMAVLLDPADALKLQRSARSLFG